MANIYKVLLEDGRRVEMTFEDVCKKLGFSPYVGLVKITTRGTISFSVEKPDEIKLLKSAVKKCGFVPAKSLDNA